MTDPAEERRPTEPPPDAFGTPTDAEHFPLVPQPDPAVADPDGGGEVAGDPDDEKWPIGFMLTIALTALYLGWRLVQGLVLLFDWLF